MKYFCAILFCGLLSKECLGGFTGLPKYCLDNVLSYQQGFGFTNHIVRPALDYNATYNIIYNGSISYQWFYGVNAYLGVGVSRILELQYGYAFMLNKHMLRIRSDIPLLDLDSNESVFYQDISIGVFLEQTFNCKEKGTTVGIALSYVLHWNSDRAEYVAKRKKKQLRYR